MDVLLLLLQDDAQARIVKFHDYDSCHQIFKLCRRA